MTPEMRRMLHATQVIGEVARRFSETGDIRGLDHLARFSLDELDRLVQLEMGMGS